MHYELRGTSFSAQNVEDIRAAFLKVCNRAIFESMRRAGFDCSANISIEAYSDAINPFIN